MKIYELDPVVGSDDWVETLFFPDCSVEMRCYHGYCSEVTSPWKNVTDRWNPSGTATNAKIRLKAFALLEEEF